MKLASHKPDAIIPSTSTSKSNITLPFSERTTVTNYRASETQESEKVVDEPFVPENNSNICSPVVEQSCDEGKPVAIMPISQSAGNSKSPASLPLAVNIIV